MPNFHANLPTPFSNASAQGSGDAQIPRSADETREGSNSDIQPTLSGLSSIRPSSSVQSFSSSEGELPPAGAQIVHPEPLPTTQGIERGDTRESFVNLVGDPLLSESSEEFSDYDEHEPPPGAHVIVPVPVLPGPSAAAGQNDGN